MPEALCGFDGVPGGASGADLLVAYGPTLLVNIRFDPTYDPAVPNLIPQAGVGGLRALVDTGAAENCIDSLLAAQLNLPVVDRQQIAGVGGVHEVNVYLAQIHITLLKQTLYGVFAGVNLAAGGSPHLALIGRTFLRAYTMVYEGDRHSQAVEAVNRFRPCESTRLASHLSSVQSRRLHACRRRRSR